MVWAFDGANDLRWDPDANTNTAVVAMNGNGTPPSAGSLQVFPSSVMGTPAFISTAPCTDPKTFEIGLLSPAGRVFSASIFVPSLSGSNYNTTSCQIGYVDMAFSQFVVAQVAPIVPGKYFTLTGTFPSNTGTIDRIFIQCTMPSTWTFGNTDQNWYVDDVSIK